MMYLEQFGDFLRALLETESLLFVRISTEDYQAQSIDEGLVSSIDGEATRELMTD